MIDIWSHTWIPRHKQKGMTGNDGRWKNQRREKNVSRGQKMKRRWEREREEESWRASWVSKAHALQAWKPKCNLPNPNSHIGGWMPWVLLVSPALEKEDRWILKLTFQPAWPVYLASYRLVRGLSQKQGALGPEKRLQVYEQILLL